MSAGIAACGFVRATPIQAATLPLLLAGQDVAAQAQTGTGQDGRVPRSRSSPASLRTKRRKAVARPARARRRADARAGRADPGRRRALGHFVKPRIVTVFGGIDYGRQRDQLRAGCDLLIGTPGRLLDYEQQGATSFGEVESLVIDEADRLFDLGFIQDLRRILRRCPPPGRRHSMLFSATLSLRVMELAYEHMNDARKIEIRPEQITADRVTQVLYHVSQREKIPLLLGLLRARACERTMLFVNTKRFAERLVSNLERHGFQIGALTGDIPQARRLKILAGLQERRRSRSSSRRTWRRAASTSTASRTSSTWTFRRTPRTTSTGSAARRAPGRSGKAISLADEDYVFSLDAIERLIGMKIPIEFADDVLFVWDDAEAGTASSQAADSRAAPGTSLPTTKRNRRPRRAEAGAFRRPAGLLPPPAARAGRDDSSADRGRDRDRASRPPERPVAGGRRRPPKRTPSPPRIPTSGRARRSASTCPRAAFSRRPAFVPGGAASRRRRRRKARQAADAT